MKVPTKAGGTLKNKQLSSSPKTFHEKPRGHMVGKQVSKPAKKQ